MQYPQSRDDYVFYLAYASNMKLDRWDRYAKELGLTLGHTADRGPYVAAHWQLAYMSAFNVWPEPFSTAGGFVFPRVASAPNHGPSLRGRLYKLSVEEFEAVAGAENGLKDPLRVDWKQLKRTGRCVVDNGVYGKAVALGTRTEDGVTLPIVTFTAPWG